MVIRRETDSEDVEEGHDGEEEKARDWDYEASHVGHKGECGVPALRPRDPVVPRTILVAGPLCFDEDRTLPCIYSILGLSVCGENKSRPINTTH